MTSAPPATPAITPPPPGGADFSKEVRLLYRVVACGGDEPVAPLDAAVVDDYCKWLLPRLADWDRDYLSKARPFLAARRPASLPTAVVYPFGGGDLLSALTTYPDALEYTTLSLEHAGDPETTIFNFHAPPYGSKLDNAPALNEDLTYKSGGQALRPVGSTSVRQAIESFQPMLGLHGHIHESKGATRIGSTLSLNPGSSYEEGILQAAVVTIDAKKRKVKNYQLVNG